MKRFLLFCALALAAYLSSSAKAESIPLNLSQDAFSAKPAFFESVTGEISMPALGGDVFLSGVKWNGEIGAISARNGKLEVEKSRWAASYTNAKLVNRIVIDVPFVGRQERIQETGLPSNLDISIENLKALNVELPDSVEVVVFRKEGKTAVRVATKAKEAVRLAVEKAIREGEWEFRIEGKRLDEVLGPLAAPLQGYLVSELATKLSERVAEQTIFPNIDIPRWATWLVENSKEEVRLSVSGWKKV